MAHIDGTIRPDGNAVGRGELREKRGTAVPAAAESAVTGEGPDDAVRSHLAYSLAATAIRNVDTVVGSDCETKGIAQLGLGCRSTIAAGPEGTCDASPDHGADDAVSRYPSNNIPGCDVEAPVGADCLGSR